MKKLLFPLLLLLIGTGAGVAAAIFVFPAPEDVTAMEATCAPETPELTADGHAQAVAVVAEITADGEDGAAMPTREYVRMNNQFVVPVVENGKVSAMIVLSLSVEVDVGAKEAVYSVEPKLRDVFLQVLFDHANIGGFDGAFTSSTNMRALRRSLKDAAQKAIGPTVTDVLIVDIVRQDV